MKTALVCFAAVGLVSASLIAQTVPPGSPRAPVVPPPGAPGSPAANRRVIPPSDPFAELMRNTDAPPQDLSGEWKGVFSANDTIVLADLALTADDNAKRKYSGQLHF